jgi:hypothetical protein
VNEDVKGRPDEVQLLRPPVGGKIRRELHSEPVLRKPSYDGVQIYRA